MRNTAVTTIAVRHVGTLVLQRLLLVALLLALWWWGAARVPSFVLPGPEKVGVALLALRRRHNDAPGVVQQALEDVEQRRGVHVAGRLLQLVQQLQGAEVFRHIGMA